MHRPNGIIRYSTNWNSPFPARAGGIFKLAIHPVYTAYEGLSTQVPVGIDEGLKHDSGIHCDEFISLPKSMLTNYVGKLPSEKIRLLERALKIALQLNDESEDRTIGLRLTD